MAWWKFSPQQSSASIRDLNSTPPTTEYRLQRRKVEFQETQVFATRNCDESNEATTSDDIPRKVHLTLVKSSTLKRDFLLISRLKHPSTLMRVEEFARPVSWHNDSTLQGL